MTKITVFVERKFLVVKQWYLQLALPVKIVITFFVSPLIILLLPLFLGLILLTNISEESRRRKIGKGLIFFGLPIWIFLFILGQVAAPDETTNLKPERHLESHGNIESRQSSVTQEVTSSAPTLVTVTPQTTVTPSSISRNSDASTSAPFQRQEPAPTTTTSESWVPSDCMVEFYGGRMAPMTLGFGAFAQCSGPRLGQGRGNDAFGYPCRIDGDNGRCFDYVFASRDLCPYPNVRFQWINSFGGAMGAPRTELSRGRVEPGARFTITTFLPEWEQGYYVQGLLVPPVEIRISQIGCN